MIHGLWVDLSTTELFDLLMSKHKFNVYQIPMSFYIPVISTHISFEKIKLVVGDLGIEMCGQSVATMTCKKLFFPGFYSNLLRLPVSFLWQLLQISGLLCCVMHVSMSSHSLTHLLLHNLTVMYTGIIYSLYQYILHPLPCKRHTLYTFTLLCLSLTFNQQVTCV